MICIRSLVNVVITFIWVLRLKLFIICKHQYWTLLNKESFELLDWKPDRFVCCIPVIWPKFHAVRKIPLQIRLPRTKFTSLFTLWYCKRDSSNFNSHSKHFNFVSMKKEVWFFYMFISTVKFVLILFVTLNLIVLHT